MKISILIIYKFENKLTINKKATRADIFKLYLLPNDSCNNSDMKIIYDNFNRRNCQRFQYSGETHIYVYITRKNLSARSFIIMPVIARVYNKRKKNKNPHPRGKLQYSTYSVTLLFSLIHPAIHSQAKGRRVESEPEHFALNRLSLGNGGARVNAFSENYIYAEYY